MTAADGVQGSPAWLEPLLRIPLDHRTGTLSIRQLFERAGPAVDDSRFPSLVRSRLSNDPDLIDAWQAYSHDKRATPNPYLDGREVGFVEILDGRPRSTDIRRYDDLADACADFINREAVWVLEERRVAGLQSWDGQS